MSMSGKGRVLLIVGPSCAGKSTLAKAVQAAAPTPFISMSLDGLFASVPDRWGGQGDLASEGFHYE
jgi:chloramphenicol 3-O phosphotransferase